MAYNSTTDTIMGDKLMLYIKDGDKRKPIAFGTACSMDITADTIDTSNKMSGNWKEFLTGQLGYTISSESLLSFKKGHLSFSTLKELMAKRKPLGFAFAVSEGDAEHTAGETVLTGEAIITSLNMNAQNGQITTSSCSLQGTGELKDGSSSGESPDSVPSGGTPEETPEGETPEG